ncbi:MULTISPECIES: LuxR C-terminal-related transcriptional regulator [unclassified Caballeronia]|uniref:LuxR C-terminal-related transcriptional regulator n=1 Tax=unclassified Caballeronia TaxID=2646786 RepID=UPI00285734F0|nr:MULTISPECIES: LuxR C-terminal-related transcriptional regulator [unclassified Caballeronia]MDR5777767.1 LuxR C-terminal-related transcriptional regulator [Caballeronia sp. LZ002]MDR5853192.1 LuxR C-terminal-related transcriptional regulator [Caballeronia sp. LZ003]
MSLRIVCAGRHLITALGTEAAVRRCAGVTSVVTTQCADELSKLALDCDVIVADLQSVSSRNNALGQPLLTRIRAGHIDVGLVLHSCIKNPAYLATLSALKAVHAVLDDDEIGVHLKPAIKAAHARKKFVSPTLAKYAATLPRRGQSYQPLTACEIDVLSATLAGQSLTDIALARRRSKQTICTHKTNGMLKLGIATSAELFRLFSEEDMCILHDRTLVLEAGVQDGASCS